MALGVQLQLPDAALAVRLDVQPRHCLVAADLNGPLLDAGFAAQQHDDRLVFIPAGQLIRRQDHGSRFAGHVAGKAQQRRGLTLARRRHRGTGSLARLHDQRSLPHRLSRYAVAGREFGRRRRRAGQLGKQRRAGQQHDTHGQSRAEQSVEDGSTEHGASLRDHAWRSGAAAPGSTGRATRRPLRVADYTGASCNVNRSWSLVISHWSLVIGH